MPVLEIRKLQPDDERFVVSCTHVGETDEWDASCQRRLPWLHEYCADDPGTRARYGIYRAMFVDGREVSWGYEAPQEGLRAAIREAQSRS